MFCLYTLRNIVSTNRNDFNETWLMEMPRGVNPLDIYDSLCYNIKDRIEYGSPVVNLGNDLYKIQGQQVVYYWYQKDNLIQLAVELAVKTQGLVVTMLAKNPDSSGPPYAADLYSVILKDTGSAIKLLSDTDMSDAALKVWVNLLKLGHKISVYDRQNPGASFITIRDVNHLSSYFKHGDADYTRYQYVLTESGEMLAETRSYFNTRRMRELSGMRLED